MTMSYISPNGHYDPNDLHNRQTVRRPQVTFIPPADPVRPAVDSSSTWKAGWIVSGLAAVLAVAALGLVGMFAFDALAQSDPAPHAASVSAPAAPPSGVTAVAPAPVPSAPVVTAYPAIHAPAPVAGAPRVVVVPGPASAPAAQDDPIVTPPEPRTPPKPPLGIGTCDLVACDPVPPQSPNPLPKCGDLVACTPIPSRP
jgi:hypothetical protein